MDPFLDDPLHSVLIEHYRICRPNPSQPRALGRYDESREEYVKAWAEYSGIEEEALDWL